jgi:hypothetical protein|nr:MAG TPA: hypothetical protein [Caudoviricetes sp.]
MDNAIAKMRAGRFIKNNGRVLRTINLLRYKYEKLEEVKYALEDMPENEYLDSLNYLSEAEYIQMRRVTSKQIAEIADVDYVHLEAKLTEKGIRLLAGKLEDDLIEV